MAAAVKGERALLGIKRSTKVTSYTSGAAVAPASGCLAVYIDMATGDEHRSLEITNKLQNLFDRARESNYLKPTNTTVYFRIPLNGSKHDIESTTDRLDIVQGDLAIGIHASLRSGASGSILFDSCFQQIRDAMFEQYGGVDPTPAMTVNEGGTVLEGGTLVVTAAMLKATDGDSYPEELVFSVTAGPANGQMEYVDDPGTAITEFTQADINSGNVAYVHDGTNTLTGNFTFSVTNGINTLGAQTFAITVTPVVDSTPAMTVNEGGTVLEGGTLVVTAAMLAATDGDIDPEELVFSVTAGPANGQMEYVDDPGTAITTFIQSDITAGNVAYVHDGTDTITGDFTFSVTNGVNTLAAQTFTITVTPVVD